MSNQIPLTRTQVNQLKKEKHFHDLCQDFVDGHNIAWLVNKYGVSKHVARKWLDEGNIVVPRGDRRKVKPEQRMFVDMEIVRQMRERNCSTKEISAVVGVCEEVVRERMIEAGIDRLAPTSRPGMAGHHKNGRKRDRFGYIEIACRNHPNKRNSGRVAEHRLVMESKLGRLLLPGEVVDHIDGFVDNNHPDNLDLYASNKDHLVATLTGRKGAAGTRSHRQLKYPLDGPIPSSLETGARQSLLSHPLGLFALGTDEFGL